MSRSSSPKKRGFSSPCRQGARQPHPRHTSPFCGKNILGQNQFSAFPLANLIPASTEQQLRPHPPLQHSCFGSTYFPSPTDPARESLNPSSNPKFPKCTAGLSAGTRQELEEDESSRISALSSSILRHTGGAGMQWIWHTVATGPNPADTTGWRYQPFKPAPEAFTLCPGLPNILPDLLFDNV